MFGPWRVRRREPRWGEVLTLQGITVLGVGEGLFPMMDGHVSSCPSFRLKPPPLRGVNLGSCSPAGLVRSLTIGEEGREGCWWVIQVRNLKKSKLQSLGHIKDELCHIHWVFYTNKNLISGSATESSSVLGWGFFVLFFFFYKWGSLRSVIQRHGLSWYWNGGVCCWCLFFF